MTRHFVKANTRLDHASSSTWCQNHDSWGPKLLNMGGLKYVQINGYIFFPASVSWVWDFCHFYAIFMPFLSQDFTRPGDHDFYFISYMYHQILWYTRTSTFFMHGCDPCIAHHDACIPMYCTTKWNKTLISASISENWKRKWRGLQNIRLTSVSWVLVIFSKTDTRKMTQICYQSCSLKFCLQPCACGTWTRYNVWEINKR